MKRFWTKATTRESGSPRRSFHWLSSRRAWFKIFPDRIECGDWRIPNGQITGAVLYRTKQLMIPFSVLEIQTEGAVYQFGFNPWVDLTQHLPFEVEERSVRLTYSVFSAVVRILLLVYLGWVVWKWLS